MEDAGCTPRTGSRSRSWRARCEQATTAMHKMTKKFSTALAVFVAASIAVGCSASRRVPSPARVAAPATRPAPSTKPAHPLIDFSRGAGGLPLPTDQLPPSPETLQTALRAAYGKRIELPAHRSIVEISGDPDAYPG